MKTIRTILGTLAAVLLGYGLLAIISFRGGAAFLQRTLYQVFSQSYFVTLVLGVAFLLIAVILTVALMSFKDDEREEKDDDDDVDYADRSLRDDIESESETETDEKPAPEMFRRPVRPLRSTEYRVDDDSYEDDSMPAFLRKPARQGVAAADIFKSAVHPSDKCDDDVPSVDEILSDLPEPASNVQEEKQHTLEQKHCVFCNAVITDGSKTCPSCGKRL